MSKIGGEEAGSLRAGRGLPGQVLVEMLLILPIFLTIVFVIMEMGYLAFRMIVLNHATYEVARIGAMTQCKHDGSLYGDCSRLVSLMQKILPSASVSCSNEPTVPDRQAGHQNYDIVVTGQNTVQLIFGFNPLESFWLSDAANMGYKTLTTTVRMPIEQPLNY